MKRESQLVALRPKISSIAYDRMTNSMEHFQNNTLRPILKFQNNLILSLFRNTLEGYKVSLEKLSETKRNLAIKEIVQNDRKLYHVLLGVIIGHFTDDELNEFLLQEKELKKRISNMMIERIQSQY